MLVKQINYTDFDGNERTETVYFNLTRTEMVELQWSVPGGAQKLFERIVEEQDIHRILEYTKEILSKAYGVKSADGRRLEKSAEHWKAFEQTLAYDQFFFELLSDASYAADVINQIIPKAEDFKQSTKSPNN